MIWSILFNQTALLMNNGIALISKTNAHEWTFKNRSFRSIEGFENKIPMRIFRLKINENGNGKSFVTRNSVVCNIHLKASSTPAAPRILVLPSSARLVWRTNRARMRHIVQPQTCEEVLTTSVPQRKEFVLARSIWTVFFINREVLSGIIYELKS